MTTRKHTKFYTSLTRTLITYRKFFLFVLLLAAWVSIFSFIDIAAIAKSIPVAGAYGVAFFVALIGGVSVFTSSSYLATIVALSLGPANPVLLALSAGTALTLGDNLFYFFGTKGRQSLPLPLVKRLDRAAVWLEGRSPTFIKLFVFVYTGFTPLPADALMLGLSFAGYPIRKVLAPIFLGNITLVLLVALLVKGGA